jgi:two-component system chemotaxis sensor kinase CheA
MSEYTNLEPMVEMYLYETTQLVDKLEQIIMRCETNNDLGSDINEIFRLMHTIKGNSMMMMYEDISNVAHGIEDLFDYLKLISKDIKSYADIINLVLETVDFFKNELITLEQGEKPSGSSADLTSSIKQYLESLKFAKPVAIQDVKSKEAPAKEKFYIGPVQGSKSPEVKREQGYYRVFIKFDQGCELENVRAFSVVHGLKDHVEDMYYTPSDIVENEDTQAIVALEGFLLHCTSYEPYDDIERYFDGVAFVEVLEITSIDPEAYESGKLADAFNKTSQTEETEKTIQVLEFDEPSEGMVAIKNIQVDESLVEGSIGDNVSKGQDVQQTKKTEKGLISVGVDKVNQLIDLIGELVVSESMVTRNQQVTNLNLDSFEKAARQHRFIIRELQDAVMSIRMVPLELTFQKMNRLVRDMSKKTGKEVNFNILGATTEVDKKVIESIGDPLMHIIRNSIDHGIEMPEDRLKYDKSPKGTISLEAKQEGGSVYIIVKDDGKGLNKQAILKKAKEKGLLEKLESDYSEKEIFNFVFQPGFSTKAAVTEFSGRGVGMDVVTRNIEEINGTVTVESLEGKGSEFIIKIPLTLAIIEGMLIRVGESVFSLPITSINESFKIKKEQLVIDNNGNELVSIRDICYPVMRLHNRFGVHSEIKNLEDGIIIMIQTDKNKVLLFVDNILGEQQLVVKNIPKYLKKVDGVTGCALLGDGKIALILDPTSLID